MIICVTSGYICVASLLKLFEAGYRSVMLKIHQIPVLSDNYVYLAHDVASGQTAVVDPATTDEVFAAIALRIYVVVGKQVKVWRDAGISGGVNGVTTNGVTKPNFKLVRYDWSQKLEED